MLKNKTSLLAFFLLFHILGLVFFEVPGANAAAAVRPHLKRTGVNLVTNPDVNGATGWGISGDASYDATVSRDAGTGSFKMTTPYPNTGFSYVPSVLIPVEPGKTYTYAMDARTDASPEIFSMLFSGFDENKVNLANGTSFGAAVSVENEWQENVKFITTDANTRFIQLRVAKVLSPRTDGHIWLDNFYFGEGVGFEQPPTPKVPFDGSITRADELGNVEIKD